MGLLYTRPTRLWREVEIWVIFKGRYLREIVSYHSNKIHFRGSSGLFSKTKFWVNFETSFWLWNSRENSYIKISTDFWRFNPRQRGFLRTSGQHWAFSGILLQIRKSTTKSSLKGLLIGYHVWGYCNQKRVPKSLRLIGAALGPFLMPPWKTNSFWGNKSNALKSPLNWVGTKKSIF